MVHAHKTLVLGGLCALKYDQFFVERGYHMGDEHAETEKQAALLNGSLLFGRETLEALRRLSGVSVYRWQPNAAQHTFAPCSAAAAFCSSSRLPLVAMGSWAISSR